MGDSEQHREWWRKGAHHRSRRGLWNRSECELIRQAKQERSYKKLLLEKGTILVNVTQFGTAQNNVNPPINNSNCSTTFTISAPTQIVSGTGAYAGITGTVNLTAQYGAVLPKTKSGSCNTSNNSNALNQYTSIIGSGTVSF